MKDNEKDRRKPDASFTVGAIALVFLAIGYQTALFIQRATVARVVGNSDHPDTVYICASPYSGENEYAGLALEAGDGVSGDWGAVMGPCPELPIRGAMPCVHTGRMRLILRRRSS